VASSACAAAAALGLVLIPIGGSQTASVDSAGSIHMGPVERMTLFQEQGGSVLVLLAVPVALTLVGLLSPARVRLVISVITTALLWVGVLAGMLSIGLFFTPAVLCAIVAIAKGKRSWPPPTRTVHTVST
jgi:hypothetical protein